MTVYRINMWSGPRNLSTALMYSFAQRSDTTVLDEPLYGHYLRATNAQHPMPDAVKRFQPYDAPDVIEQQILGPVESPVFFIKNMAHHLVDIDLSFLKQITNVLLVRAPSDMLPSLYKKLGDLTLRDTGYDKLVMLTQWLETHGREPIVVDSRKLAEQPARVLAALCNTIGIPYDDAMLSWAAGPKPYDGVWASHWYDAVHQSTGFRRYRPKPALPDHLSQLSADCEPLYNHLKQYQLEV